MNINELNCPNIIYHSHGASSLPDAQAEDGPIFKQRMADGTLTTPYDKTLLDEFNTEKHTLTKTGQIALNHSPGTHDNRFLAKALAAYAAEAHSPTQPQLAPTV